MAHSVCAACAAKDRRPEPSAAGGPQSRGRTLIERIKCVEEDRAELAGDLREIYAEAKGEGYDTKALRQVVRERHKDPLKRREERGVFELYASAVGLEG